jgi:hypothetical protein
MNAGRVHGHWSRFGLDISKSGTYGASPTNDLVTVAAAALPAG